MKRDKVIYWISTGIVSVMMLVSAYINLTSEEFMKTFTSFGFPRFFVTILGTAKLLGAIALVAPLPDKVKEWAYAGFSFVFIGAVWTHLATHTPWVAPIGFLVVLAISYYFRTRLKSSESVPPGNIAGVHSKLANVTARQ